MAQRLTHCAQNWFQNRRAKTKQDAKKAQGAINLAHAYQSNRSSDSEPSPFQSSHQYAAMMAQHFAADAQLPNGMSLPQIPSTQDFSQMQIPMYQDLALAHQQQLDLLGWQPQQMTDFYDDTTQELNRRTLTQEAFDAITRNGGMVNAHGQFEQLQSEFSGDQDLVNQIFGGLPIREAKQEELAFPFPIGAPLSSHDSTVPSVLSEQSYQFPVDSAMQSHTNASGSDWTDSRSSSLSMLQQESSALQQPPPAAPTTSQWQPGQSVPVDVSKHYEEFRQAAEARAAESQPPEQPLAYPRDAAFADDAAFLRRDSHASMVTQSMANVNIHTPQPNQSAVFKSPAPPANIAARRQRPRPAPIGLAALRSQSYGGPGQPSSPGQGPQPAQLTQDQQLRRIRSAAVMNGGVAHGRVMKSTPGSAQRSPVNWTFANALVSPHFLRSASHGNLAPPTPMSPRDVAQHEQALQAAAYQQYAHQPSISETEFEQSLGAYQSSASVPAQNFSSPPHTPLFYDTSFNQRVANSIITENTPPQSAPAGQSCFPSNIFTSAPQHVPQQQPPPPPPPQHHAPPVQHPMQPRVMQQPHPPQIVEQQPQQYHVPTVTFAPSQQSNVTTGPPPGVPLQFANGIPTVTAEGTVKMSFPPQAQLMHQQSQRMQTPPQTHYSFVTNGSPNSQGLQTPSELQVHQYTPPDAVKRSSTPRKAVETGPKNYTFANHGPLDYEKKEAKREARDSANPCSPASSSGTASSV